MGLCGVIVGWIWIGAGPRSRFLQGVFPQSDIKIYFDIKIYLKTRETSSIPIGRHGCQMFWMVMSQVWERYGTLIFKVSLVKLRTPLGSLLGIKNH